MSESIIEQESDPNLDVASGFAQLRESSEEGEAEPEAQPEGRARDEKGQFAPKAETEAAPDDEKILGKFRSVDDLVTSYTTLEAELGRQAHEIGQLRKTVETPAEEPYYPPDQGTVDWFDQQVEENPHGAAVWAIQNDRSGALYNRAMDSWYEMQPRQASAFERQLEMSQFAQVVQAQNQPLQAQAQQQEFVNAWQAAATALPDLSNYAETILTAAESAPELLVPLQQGTIEDKRRVIENLYWLAKGKQADSLSQVSQQFAQDESESERTAAQAATVAGASSIAVSEDKGPSKAQQIWGTAPPSFNTGLTTT